MYTFLTLLQIILPIAFGGYVFIIYQHGLIGSKTLEAGACNELAVAVLIFVILQLLTSYLMKKCK